LEGDQVSDDQARLAIFKAFIEDDLDAPKHLAREVWRNWRSPLMRSFGRGRLLPPERLH